MPDEAILREAARKAIQGGKLPARRPDNRTTLVGTDSGVSCAMCGETVSHNETGLEIEFRRPEPRVYSLHTRCFSAWEIVSVEIEQNRLRGR